MYRSPSLEVSHRSSARYAPVVPHRLNDEKNCHDLQFQKNYPNKSWRDPGPYIQQGDISYHRINQTRCRWLPRKINNLDYQISHIIHENNNNIISRISQSQSFNEGPLSIGPGLSYRENPPPQQSSHISRLNTYAYMSPPPPQWTTVGNIMLIKRSTSMPGSRPNSVTIPCQPSQGNDVSHSSMKKKCGPFQCLKHQFRRSAHKEANAIHDNQNSPQINSNVSSKSMKTSKSMFKKRPITAVANTADQSSSSSTKSRGIRKSISLLFSKSHRSSKSDPSIVNKIPVMLTDKEKNSSEDKTNAPSYQQHTSRRNRSYESMLESGEIKLSNETNKSCSYSDVQDSSSSSVLSHMKTTAAVSVDVILCRRSPSEASLADSVSVSSSEHQLSSQIEHCQGSINYQTEDNGWKTVVGNVCRSNSKDSAIANSTLSGDGVINQSKRVSLTSTISRTSDITTTSEDFNDSSYSSFNDLQTNFSQYSYSKPRFIGSGVSNLEPIKVICDTVESDISPSSDSSTETLRPRSVSYRGRYRSSDPSVITIGRQMTAKFDTDLKQKCLKRSHSWPGCQSHIQNTGAGFKSKPAVLSPLSSKSAHCPKLKLSYIQQSHLNSSPLLSQYSRLYSLRSSAVKDQRSQYCISSTTQTTMSPSNHSNVTNSVFLRGHSVRRSKNW